jgi:hypothetical protein
MYETCFVIVRGAGSEHTVGNPENEKSPTFLDAKSPLHLLRGQFIRTPLDIT